ncbi:MAG: hypothetical protein PHI84_12385 [Kiritimatiellae bacterium]|nr:hypothetical protein [Kiritimatiellia bacterium]
MKRPRVLVVATVALWILATIVMNITFSVQPSGWVLMFFLPLVGLLPNSIVESFSSGPIWTPVTLITVLVLIYVFGAVAAWRRNTIPLAIVFTVIVITTLLIGYWQIYRGLTDL